MAKFFNYFPKTLYTNELNNSGIDSVTNIISRFSFEENLKENISAFYEYDIQESDTPEIIAHKYYGDSEKHWVVLLFNDIMDPQYDWPLQYSSFIKYIDNKYSANNYADTANTSVTGLSWSQNTNNIKSYFKIITQSSGDNDFVEKVEVDGNTYANVAASTSNYTLQNGSNLTITITKETQTYYDFELEENENKRKIKLLKSEFIYEVEKEFKKASRL
jgi:hypothetical protein